MSWRDCADAGGVLDAAAAAGELRRARQAGQTLDVLLSEEEIALRHKELKPAEITNHTPWEEFYRSNVGQLETGACLEFAVKYHDVRKVVPRHSH